MEDQHWPQAPRMLRCQIMPAGGAYPPDWVAFAKTFDTPRVDPSCPGFCEQWHYILAWVYHKHCLDATHKWKVASIPPVEV